jgi:hypothetical protein
VVGLNRLLIPYLSQQGTCHRIDISDAVLSVEDSLPPAGDVDCHVRVLTGDANSSGSLRLGDALLMKAYVEAGTTAEMMPRLDVTLSGGPIQMQQARAVLLFLKPIPRLALCP